MTEATPGIDGGFHAELEFSNYTLKNIIIKGFSIMDEVFTLTPKTAPTKVPVSGENEFSIVIPLNSALKDEATTVGAVGELISWYRATKEATILTFHEKSNVGIKNDEFKFKYKRGTDDIFIVGLKGVFPKGLVFAGLTAPGEAKLEVAFSYDSVTRLEVVDLKKKDQELQKKLQQYDKYRNIV